MPATTPDPSRDTVGLFVTCLVDLFRPSIGFASIKLIEQAGFNVTVPGTQSCCGQPAYNAGDRRSAIAIARQIVAAFGHVDHVVVPSGSCAAMLKHHIPDLLRDDSAWGARASEFAERVRELTCFLVEKAPHVKISSTCSGSVTYHDSCSGLRELGIREQPRSLLAQIEPLNLIEMEDADVCCGFGGMFCVKYPDLSNAIVGDKTRAIARTGAREVLAGDLGCLLNIAGKMAREKCSVRARHVAEVLAGMHDTPAIGAPAGRSGGPRS